MTLDEFLDIREKREISLGKVKEVLETCGYSSKFIDTHCVNATERKGTPAAYEYKKATCKAALTELKLPCFVYIKFYCDKSYNGTEEKFIYALVVGKTKKSNQDISFRPPEKPRGSRGDKAKWWIKDRAKTHRWYDEKVLIVWTPDLECEDPTADEWNKLNKEVISLERKIRQLFGLFSS